MPKGASGASESSARHRSAEANRVLAEHEREIINRQTEKAVIINPQTGEVILEKTDGKVDSVTFTREEIDKMVGAVFTHNHPGGRAFGDADLRFMAVNGLQEIRAVGRGTETYSMRVGNGLRPTVDEFNDFARNANSQIEDKMWSLIGSGQITPEQASRMHQIEFSSMAAKEYGWTFERSARR